MQLAPALGTKISGLEMPGVDPRLADSLKNELVRVPTEAGALKYLSIPPMTASNQVADLAAADDGSGGADLSWTYRSVGDYDQNGEANISDLTQIGIHFGKNSTSPDWDAAQLADGDENGEVNLADVTPLGLNFGNQASGYKVFSSMDSSDYPAGPDDSNGAGAVEAGQILLSAATPGPGGRLEFDFNLASHTPGTHYWVRPFHAGGALGAVSNMATLGVADPTWTHTWGGATYEGLNGVAYHNEGAIYAVGGVLSQAWDYDLLLLKFDLGGNPVWTRKWGSTGDEWGSSVAIGGEGEVYVTGSTESFGSGATDVLLQRWDTAGNLVWSRTWGGSENDTPDNVAFRDGAIYIQGNTKSFISAAGDALVLKFDLEGNVLWARALGGDAEDKAWDMQTHWSFLANETSIHITGGSRSYVPSGQALFYAKIDEDGDTQTVRIWEGGDSQYGRCISVSGTLPEEVFICGMDWEGRILLLEHSTQPDAVSKTWETTDHQSMNDMLRVGSSLVACGSYPEGVSYTGLLMNFSLEGAVQGAEIWMYSGGIGIFECIDIHPDAGFVGCGTADAIPGGSWEPISGTLVDVSGTWSTIPDTADAVTGVVATQSLEPEEPIGAVIDEGGGGGDVIIFARDAP